VLCGDLSEVLNLSFAVFHSKGCLLLYLHRLLLLLLEPIVLLLKVGILLFKLGIDGFNLLVGDNDILIGLVYEFSALEDLGNLVNCVRLDRFNFRSKLSDDLVLFLDFRSYILLTVVGYGADNGLEGLSDVRDLKVCRFHSWCR
jgi:hypothetical protein